MTNKAASKPSVRTFAKRLSEKFPVLMREILRYENNYLTRGTITPPQLWALFRLSQKRACKMCELACLMNAKFSSATGLVDRMVRQGLVKRERSSKDRRQVLVQITAKGRRIFIEIKKQKQEGIARLFGRLSASERAKYLEIIEKLVRNLSRQSLCEK